MFRFPSFPAGMTEPSTIRFCRFPLSFQYPAAVHPVDRVMYAATGVQRNSGIRTAGDHCPTVSFRGSALGRGRSSLTPPFQKSRLTVTEIEIS